MLAALQHSPNRPRFGATVEAEVRVAFRTPLFRLPLHELMAVVWVFTQVIEPLLVVHVESRLEEVVEEFHPLGTSIVSFQKRSEGFPPKGSNGARGPLGKTGAPRRCPQLLRFSDDALGPSVFPMVIQDDWT